MMYHEINSRSEKEKVVEYLFNKKRASAKSFWSIHMVRNMKIGVRLLQGVKCAQTEFEINVASKLLTNLLQ